MYEVHLLEDSGTVVAKLETSSKTVAHDFCYDSIINSWRATNYRIGLYDKDYGYYAMAIPHPENSLSKAFEIICLADLDFDTEKYYCIPEANDKMYTLLDE